jgi:hypothetical protein
MEHFHMEHLHLVAIFEVTVVILFADTRHLSIPVQHSLQSPVDY